ncbi:uridine diphosphate glucose pyrophosphatase NUDT22 isoform X1 [Xenopus laevis]|uniref:Uridine diphosphate glucose pyrophosphatase NUDT22 isoform X1 n=3 Tax=Xenopus laevis TaxID=8355 RepID=A0A8J0V0X3_XENLA|nr:uridine diphosphate glucose pyrophosphatase NUDT22 isoform X1 [Xenopus laevis]
MWIRGEAPMDPEISILYCSPFPEGLPQRRVQAQLSPHYQRRRLPPPLEDQILLEWEERKRKQPWVFNGAKFRLHSVKADLNQREKINRENTLGEIGDHIRQEADMDEQGGLTLYLALTSYRDFLGTNWSGNAKALQERGGKEHGDPEAYLAQPLGVGAALQCSDGRFVLLRRSNRVGEAPGQLDIPGGHPEPKAVAPNIPEDELSLDVLKPELVITELFSSILAEIRDEVNLPLWSLSEPLLLGIARNHTSAGRPSAEFYVRCSFSSEEVRERYLQGGPEASESTDIMFIDREEMLSLETSELWKELCPSAKGCVKLYLLVREQQS